MPIGDPSSKQWDLTMHSNDERVDAKTGCIFCYPNVTHRIVVETGKVVAIYDLNPVTAGHMLVIPKRHVPTYFDLTDAERRDADHVLERVILRLAKDDPTISGYNIGVNCGASAGQTIFHVHYHLIPRRDGDCRRPRGGVRGVIPIKMFY